LEGWCAVLKVGGLRSPLRDAHDAALNMVGSWADPDCDPLSSKMPQPDKSTAPEFRFGLRIMCFAGAECKRCVAMHGTGEELPAPALAAAAAGLIASPIVLWSEFTLKTTGAGLQGDLLGAAEGVSYLVRCCLAAARANSQSTVKSESTA
jgi:hypothetical protein